MKFVFQSFWTKLICLILCFCLIMECKPLLAEPLSDTSQNILATSGSIKIAWSYPAFKTTIHTQYTVASIKAWWRRLTNRDSGGSGSIPPGPEGISRGSCNTLSQEFMAILPSLESLNQISNEFDEKELKSGTPLFGLTAYQSPTLWFYIPELPTGISTAELMLQQRENDKNKDILNEPIRITNLSSESGFLGVDLETVSASPIILEPDKLYSWYFSLICNNKRPSRNPSVSGWIGYEPSVGQTGLDNSSDRQRISKYKADEIWHDALTLSAKLRCNGMSDTEWFELLEEIGIDEDIAGAEIKQCSTVF